MVTLAQPRIVLPCVGLAILILAGVAALDLFPVRNAQAQTDAAAPPAALQTPPPVPGVDYTIEDPKGVILEGMPMPATPAPPVMPGDAVVVTPEAGADHTANLGGSDIAVSSVGGDHQVDTPGKRGNKKRRQ